MPCFGGSKETQRARDDKALIERYRKEIGVLKQDAARLERELQDVRESSSLQLSEKDDEVVALREENEDLRNQLTKAEEKEEGVAEYTVSLIKEIAELKGKLRGSGERDEAWGKDENVAQYEEEIQNLKTQLEDAQDEAKGYSEEIGDLAKQISDLQQKSLDASAYRKEIQHLKMKLGGDDASSLNASGVSAMSSMVDSVDVSSRYSATSPSLSDRITAVDASASVISTVSLTSGFFGVEATEKAVTLSNATPQDAATKAPMMAAKSSVVTPPGKVEKAGETDVSPIDAEAVARAVKCVEELIRRFNNKKTKGKISRKELFKKEVKKHIEFVGMPSTMSDDTEAAADSSMVSAASYSTNEKRESEHGESSSFYSAASAEGGKMGDGLSLQVAVEAKSPSQSKSASQSTGIFDTSSWKPVGTTGELLLVSDESTINTEDADFDDEIRSCHSAYSAPVSPVKARNDSAVIVAELCRVQSLLSSALESTPNADQHFRWQDLVRKNSLPSNL